MVVRVVLRHAPDRLRTLGRVIAVFLIAGMFLGGLGSAQGQPSHRADRAQATAGSTASSAPGNFSAAIDRLVELLGIAGSGLLSIVWARVALSWFSNDITKKVQAKDRARDALVGTLLFTAAITGLFWGLAHWVLTGS